MKNILFRYNGFLKKTFLLLSIVCQFLLPLQALQETPTTQHDPFRHQTITLPGLAGNVIPLAFDNSEEMILHSLRP